ncbi:polysaccharide biosynthesis/export family protein [Mucilaginibacter daejeonensis]|uniref:polysaccharide biosynthesis/export family protein n=1 Tax=Mucilaginibacter daejeonensis TaxID=398049 RepID=UPI001D1730F4|nr:polysaccharide biosynthesis/export family protein [Mucilaginibacter daejeonensis]UEG54940.1 polysaccharide biosynthesis/export family protein [Mucilaginibacter daejeonensis]
MKNFDLLFKWCAIVSLPLIMSSCSSIKNVKYFTDIPDSQKITNLATLKYEEPRIQPDDILSINIQTVDPSATKVLATGTLQNSAVGATTAGSTGSQTISGYLVDNSGNIELPVLGKIKVSTLTTEQAREEIRARATKLYKDPTVNLRFANFKITVMGEVAKPGVYVASNEKVNILDALGLAGDITIYGKRENIALIRQFEDGSRKMIRLDLTKSEILNSPYYYLRQNDYLYVEPTKSKVVSSDAIQNRNISIITAVTASLISLIAIIISRN